MLTVEFPTVKVTVRGRTVKGRRHWGKDKKSSIEFIRNNMKTISMNKKSKEIWEKSANTSNTQKIIIDPFFPQPNHLQYSTAPLLIHDSSSMLKS